MDTTQNSTFETCIICMEDYSDAKVATQVTRCGHHFHAECYYAAYLSSKQHRKPMKCPFCTIPITTHSEVWICYLKDSFELINLIFANLRVKDEKEKQEIFQHVIRRRTFSRLRLW